jgi:hypothetical protein
MTTNETDRSDAGRVYSGSNAESVVEHMVSMAIFHATGNDRIMPSSQEATNWKCHVGNVAALLCALIPGTFAQAMNTKPGGQHLQTDEQTTRYPRTAALVDGMDARHNAPFVPSLSSLKNDHPIAHISDPKHCSLGAMDAPANVAIIGDSNAASSFPGLSVLDLTDGI